MTRKHKDNFEEVDFRTRQHHLSQESTKTTKMHAEVDESIDADYFCSTERLITFRSTPLEDRASQLKAQIEPEIHSRISVSET